VQATFRLGRPGGPGPLVLTIKTLRWNCVPQSQLLQSMQKCLSKMTRVAVSNRLAFLYV